MTSRLLEIATFEALALFELLSPRLRNDRLSRMVVSGEAGQRARRLLRFAVAVTAVGGALTIALVPDNLFYWIFAILMVVPPAIGMAFLEWQRRAVVSLDDEPSDRMAVLHLDDERIPRTVWLAAVAPLLTLGLVVWLGVTWGALEPRVDYETTKVAWRHPAFRTLVQFLLMDIGWGTWFALYALIVWHGMPRRYTFRASQLTAAVATVWSVALLTPAIAMPLLFRLPVFAVLLCLAAGLIAIRLYVVYALRARREVAGAHMPPSSQAFYFDRNDPSAFGDRGLNLGSPWNWALFAAPAAFFMAPMLLFLL
jgi:hypothetical protein